MSSSTTFTRPFPRPTAGAGRGRGRAGRGGPPPPGRGGLRRMAQTAVINANYLMSQLKGSYDLPYDRFCKHECVFSNAIQTKKDVHTLDIAKRLMDYGFHPPTIYFPP